jgi:hypothetical protein
MDLTQNINIVMKSIFALTLFVLMMGSFMATAQTARQNKLERREDRLERREDRVDKRNPDGIGRRDERLDRREKRVDRKQRRTHRRVKTRKEITN